jgi:hypothetical protein
MSESEQATIGRLAFMRLVLDKKVIVKNSAVIPVSVPHLGDLITYGKIPSPCTLPLANQPPCHNRR